MILYIFFQYSLNWQATSYTYFLQFTSYYFLHFDGELEYLLKNTFFK